MSSGASSAPGFRRAAGRRRTDESRTAPVVYRANPMVYEGPDRFCHCNLPRKAPRRISWSVLNPDRRYYACVDAMVTISASALLSSLFCYFFFSMSDWFMLVQLNRNGRGCGYVEWHDPPLPKFWSDLLGDSRSEVWRPRGQENMPRSGK
jgi:hypothetical protein